MSRPVPFASLPSSVQQKLTGRASPNASRGKKPRRLTVAQLKRAEQRARTEQRAREFKRLCVANGLPLPTREYVFDAMNKPRRQFRFDFAWIEEKLALECDGGIWTRGAHGRGTGITRDHEKRNLATLQGWRVLHCVPKALNADATIELVRQALAPHP
jgi:very-short-patch-repair endonuclease